MSKIEQLIKRLCPNGVKYYTLEDIVKEVNIGINPRKFFKLNPIDAVGFYVTVRELNGLSGVKQYEKTDTINEEAIKIINERAHIEKGDILFSNTGTVGKLALVNEIPTNWGVNEGIYIIKPINKIINSKYLYYFLDSSHAYKDYSLKFTGSTLKHVTQKALLSLKVAVPPLEVQDEIVHILDDFTLLSAELSAELKAREKQYNFYKDELLSKECVKRVNLGSLCKVITKGTTPSAFSKEGITFIKTEAFENGNINKNKLSFISEEIHNGKLKRSILEENDILFTIAGATIGKMAVVTKDLLPANTNQALAIIRLKEGINMKYIKFILSSNYMKVYIQRCVKGSAQPNLNLQQLNEFEFPFPDDEKQNEIVNVLEKLDIYTHDILCGLPAEIEARKKQYEYYRDKLLTFEEKKDE